MNFKLDFIISFVEPYQYKNLENVFVFSKSIYSNMKSNEQLFSDQKYLNFPLLHYFIELFFRKLHIIKHGMLYAPKFIVTHL